MRILVIFLIFLTSLMAHAQLSRTQSLARRIDAFSSQFIGLPYINGALGEGFGYDADPLYRFDGFDCTTFVETISALALSKDQQDFEFTLQHLRYKDGLVDFKTRNHFTSLDWIPNNIAQNLITDRTRSLFPRDFAIARTLIDKKAWYLKSHQMEDPSLPQISQIAYLPLAVANAKPAILERIPSGSIIHIVRLNWGLKDRIGTDLDVSHEGFVIRKTNGTLYLRHASSEKKFVTEEPLAEYLARMSAIKSIAGINVVQLR